MKGDWCYFLSYFNKETCKKIIADGLELPAHNARMGASGQTEDNQYRRSKIRFINKNDTKFGYVFDALWKTAIQANDDYFNFHISRLDYLQLAEYDAAYKGEYKEHHDVFWMNDDPHYHRKLSCIVQLSDPADYDGGDLEITEAKNPLDAGARQQGTLIYFPSMLRHKANQVTRGTRYSLAAWFDGPKWR